MAANEPDVMVEQRWTDKRQNQEVWNWLLTMPTKQEWNTYVGHTITAERSKCYKIWVKFIKTVCSPDDILPNATNFSTLAKKYIAQRFKTQHGRWGNVNVSVDTVHTWARTLCKLYAIKQKTTWL